MSNTNRRRFLYVAGAGGVAAAFGLGSLRSDRSKPDRDRAAGGFVSVDDSTVTRTSWALGSNVSITVVHSDHSVARQAIDAAFDELELVEQVMSIYRPHSQLCQLNREGVVNDPHSYLVEVLQASHQMAERSAGAFDVTVQPLWNLYDVAKGNGQLPSASAVATAKTKIDWRSVDVCEGRISLRRKGSAITLNGIAQGFAADRALAALRQHDVRHALVDTGELGSRGVKADGRAWSVGIQHPRDEDAFVAIAKLDGRCLATSGDYATTFSADRANNHLFDPRTGRSPSELSSVSIATPTGMQADALSTAVFVLGAERGLELIRTTADTDALLVLKDGRTLTTERFPLAT
jgi:FAD:protein FMN transferase